MRSQDAGKHLRKCWVNIFANTSMLQITAHLFGKALFLGRLLLRPQDGGALWLGQPEPDRWSVLGPRRPSGKHHERTTHAARPSVAEIVTGASGARCLDQIRCAAARLHTTTKQRAINTAGSTATPPPLDTIDAESDPSHSRHRTHPKTRQGSRDVLQQTSAMKH